MKDANKNQLFVELTLEEAAVINGGRRGEPEPGDDRGGGRRGGKRRGGKRRGHRNDDGPNHT